MNGTINRKVPVLGWEQTLNPGVWMKQLLLEQGKKGSHYMVWQFCYRPAFRGSVQLHYRFWKKPPRCLPFGKVLTRVKTTE